jgi:hypothetical protein
VFQQISTKMLRHSLLQRAKAPHAVLGIAANATEEQIKAKYKELARRLHPDMPGGSERKFQELNAAYQILKMRAQARQPGGRAKQARTMNMYRGEDDKEDDADTSSKWKSYVDEEEEAELRAQERAAEELRRMSSQTFAEMMWTMSTYELIISLSCFCAAVMLSFHRRIELTRGDKIDFADVNAEGEDQVRFNAPIVLTEEQKFIRDTYRETTENRTQTSHTKFYHIKDVLFVYDAERAHARRVEAKPVAADLVDEKRLIEDSPIVARIDASGQVTPYHNISLKLKERVAQTQWAHVDVGPAINLMLEACRRVPKNDPAAYRITTLEYRYDDPHLEGSSSVAIETENNNDNKASTTASVNVSLTSQALAVATGTSTSGSNSSGNTRAADSVPRVVVTIVNDKFAPNKGRCQRIVISGFDELHPELISKRRAQLRDRLYEEKDLKNLKLIFPINDEGIQRPEGDKDERIVIFEPPQIFGEKTKW